MTFTNAANTRFMITLTHFDKPVRFRLCLMLMGLLLLPVQSFATAKIYELRVWRSPDKTRLVFDIDKAVTHKVFSLANPDRVVVDIPNAKFSSDPAAVDLSKTPVSQLRHASKQNGDLRVVFDLSQAVKVRSFFLPKNAVSHDRLVIDLFDSQQADSISATVKNVDTIKSERRDLIIAIDAGHGGEDPGAIGPKRLYEKHVVLKIAKALEAKFKQEKGYKPVLIRKGDYYIPLAKRREIARKANADMFISIHADAFTSPKANGTSVFALSSKGATSTFARVLAKRENDADLVGGVSLNDKDQLLSSVLLDLSMTHKMQASLEVGERILGHMGKISRLHSKRVEQAAFAVLKTPDIPSLLVETGFISNPGEAKKLSTVSYRNKMADAIFKGVHSWFKDKAPEDSYIAHRYANPSSQSIYVVEAGDTLSGIADKYSVSMASIQKYNKLTKTSIRVGQRLEIPPAN